MSKGFGRSASVKLNFDDVPIGSLPVVPSNDLRLTSDKFSLMRLESEMRRRSIRIKSRANLIQLLWITLTPVIRFFGLFESNFKPRRITLRASAEGTPALRAIWTKSDAWIWSYDPNTKKLTTKQVSSSVFTPPQSGRQKKVPNALQGIIARRTAKTTSA